MRGQNTPIAEVKAAYHRERAKPTVPQPVVAEPNTVTVLAVCNAYLDQALAVNAKATYDNRADALFDFCFGLPARFRHEGKAKPKPSDYIHSGYGQVLVGDLRPLDIDTWLQKHPTWKGAKRTKIQAVKRALNYGVEAGLIPANPIKGYKTPKQNARTTYITPEQETAFCDDANDSLAIAIKVCIRTGARPGCEFASVTAKHIKDHGERMEWIFQPAESKTNKLRTIRIADAGIIAIVRDHIRQNPKGPIFRNTDGTPWTRENLSHEFRRVKNRLEKKGMVFDADMCMYACRHTYAKRIIQGYWSGKQTNVETLARLMGNSPDVCRDHYLQWTETYNEPLWESA